MKSPTFNNRIYPGSFRLASTRTLGLCALIVLVLAGLAGLRPEVSAPAAPLMVSSAAHLTDSDWQQAMAQRHMTALTLNERTHGRWDIQASLADTQSFDALDRWAQQQGWWATSWSYTRLGSQRVVQAVFMPMPAAH
ncbi:hypothetical protein ACKC9G_12020 [Pokkaliibacter sp. CJK22405]|uniref:hypothetical protein n=1 Tax=Pokkaliibacter sp. CJK22405 TaxID=3384615 RepID=UPI003984FAC7